MSCLCPFSAMSPDNAAEKCRIRCSRTVCRPAGAVELRNTLAAKFAVELPPTVTLDYPSVTALASHLATQLIEVAAAGSAAEEDEEVFEVQF